MPAGHFGAVKPQPDGSSDRDQSAREKVATVEFPAVHRDEIDLVSARSERLTYPPGVTTSVSQD